MNAHEQICNVRGFANSWRAAARTTEADLDIFDDGRLP